MNLWTIITPEKEYEIEVSKNTLLYKQHYEWYKLTRYINEFFNTRNSNIEIFEDGIPINKKDWNCFFIPYDVNIQLSKVTTSSPLKKVQSDIIQELMYSPIYQELNEVWELLNEELEIINKKIEKWNIRTKLSSLDEKSLSQFIHFYPVHEDQLSPIEMKSLLINIINENEFEKKTLLIVELPELFANESEINIFYQLVNKISEKGYRFLFVSDLDTFGIKNYIYKNKIINSVILEQIKQKVFMELPFYCTENLYNRSKEVLFYLVDNSLSEDELIKICGDNFGQIITIINVIFYYLDIERIYVEQGLEPNLRRYNLNIQ